MLTIYSAADVDEKEASYHLRGTGPCCVGRASTRRGQKDRDVHEQRAATSARADGVEEAARHRRAPSRRARTPAPEGPPGPELGSRARKTTWPHRGGRCEAMPCRRRLVAAMAPALSSLRLTPAASDVRRAAGRRPAHVPRTPSREVETREGGVDRSRPGAALTENREPEPASRARIGRRSAPTVPHLPRPGRWPRPSEGGQPERADAAG
jgi:hypothetical protein